MYNLLYIFKKFKNNTLFKCENCNNFRKLSNSIINKASIHNNLKKKVCKYECKCKCNICKETILFNNEIDGYILPEKCFNCNINIYLYNQKWYGKKPWEINNLINNNAYKYYMINL